MNCDPGDSLWVQLDGTARLDNSNAQRYCGSNQQIQNVSSFNSVTIGAYNWNIQCLLPFDQSHKLKKNPYVFSTLGYTASRFSGYYQCNFVATPTSKCDCGQRTQVCTVHWIFKQRYQISVLVCYFVSWWLYLYLIRGLIKHIYDRKHVHYMTWYQISSP